jgi:hypothetical protein
MVNEEQQIGFYYRDLPQVARVLELIHDRLQNKNVSILSWRLYVLV